MEIQDFLETIYGTGKGIATIVTKNVFSGELTDQKFFQYPEQITEMVQLSEANAHRDVYYSPILYSAERRIRENAKTVSVVYADADTCDPANFLLKPSIAVQTSEGRWHTYWILDGEADPQEVALAAKKIAYAHQHQGCDLSGWNPTKLLRIPNTTNTKHNAGERVEAFSSGQIYTLAEINETYGDVAVEPIRQLSNEAMPEALPQVAQALAKVSSSAEVLSLYMDEPLPGTDLSKRLWKLELELFRQGLTPDEVFIIAKNAKCNKYHRADRQRRIDPDGDLWREVQRAKETHDSDPTGALAAPEELVKHDEPKPISFLKDDERTMVRSKSCFVDEYMEWATSKTDGAVQYQVASAFTILSSVYSELGYAVPKFGKMGLNLWFMVLGETTLTRKSTSRNLMLKVIRKFEELTGDQVDIGSNVTAEGLVKLLSQRDGKTSLFHRDEVQGMFKEFITKTYMATAAEQFTELYDGHVPVVVRSANGGSQTDRAETNFLMYAMGITSKTADVLTTEYFRSGFLARFVYVLADTPPRTFEGEAIQQSDDHEVFVKDEGLDRIIKSLHGGVTFWQKKGAPTPRPIRLSQQALDRFNEFKWDMGNYAEGHTHAESIEPSRQRLALSIWKCATLLAMHDKQEEVGLIHMLLAINYAEEWFGNLVKMAGAISASEWQRDVDQLETVITDKGGKIRYEEAYKRFANKKKREFDEMIEALKSQGRAAVYGEQGKTYIEVAK